MKQQVQRHSCTRIGPPGRAALHLLACCPRTPTDVLAVVLGFRHTRSAAQLLARLRGVGLAQYQVRRLGPLLGSRPVRLWTLTPAGQAVLASQGLAPSLMDDGRLPYGNPERWPETARQRDLPMLIAAYQLLVEAVGSLPQPVRMVAWEHPWIRMLQPPEGGRGRHVRLPAAAVVINDDLGISGAQSSDRPGYQRLVSMLALREVGIVFGLEVSRLARNCLDWYQLLELAAAFNVLIAMRMGCTTHPTSTTGCCWA